MLGIFSSVALSPDAGSSFFSGDQTAELSLKTGYILTENVEKRATSLFWRRVTFFYMEVNKFHHEQLCYENV